MDVELKSSTDNVFVKLQRAAVLDDGQHLRRSRCHSFLHTRPFPKPPCLPVRAQVPPPAPPRQQGKATATGRRTWSTRPRSADRARGEDPPSPGFRCRAWRRRRSRHRRKRTLPRTRRHHQGLGPRKRPAIERIRSTGAYLVFYPHWQYPGHRSRLCFFPSLMASAHNDHLSLPSA